MVTCTSPSSSILVREGYIGFQGAFEEHFEGNTHENYQIWPKLHPELDLTSLDSPLMHAYLYAELSKMLTRYSWRGSKTDRIY